MPLMRSIGFAASLKITNSLASSRQTGTCGGRVFQPLDHRYRQRHGCDVEVLVHKKVIAAELGQSYPSRKNHISERHHAIIRSILLHRKKASPGAKTNTAAYRN